MDFSSFFSSSEGTTGGSGKGGGAGYSSDVSDSGQVATDINVVVGGIGTTTAGQSAGTPASMTASPNSILLYALLGGVALLALLTFRR